MATFGKSSKSRTYIIVYGKSGKNAHAALKIKLPNKIVNNAKGAGTYMQKFLNIGEQILTVQAYEDLSFLSNIKRLKLWNEDEVKDEKPKKTTSKSKARTKKENGIEEFESMSALLKGEAKEDDGDKTTEE